MLKLSHRTSDFTDYFIFGIAIHFLAMKCLICNSDNLDNASFCVKCGKPLWIKCSCTNTRQYGLKFCPYCGRKTQEQIDKEKQNEETANGCFSVIAMGVIYIILIILSPILTTIGIDYRAVGVTIAKYFDEKE